MQLDAAGNIYLAGTVTPVNPQPVQNTSDAFVAKVSADGAKVVYFTVVGGSFADTTAALAVGPDGSAYIAGSTGSTEFSVTTGALQSTFNQAGASQGFLVKVDPTGAVVNATYVNGTAFTQVTGLALGKTGEIYLTVSVSREQHSLHRRVQLEDKPLSWQAAVNRIIGTAQRTAQQS